MAGPPSRKAREMVKLALTQGSHRFEWFSKRYDGRELPLDIVMTAVPFGERTLLSLVSELLIPGGDRAAGHGRKMRPSWRF